MQVSDWLIGTSIVVAVVFVTVSRWMSKRGALNGRKLISLAEMYQRDEIRIGVSYENFEKVFDMIGRAYNIDPRLLRPSDKLKTLYALDSWDLGEGTAQLNERVAKDFGITRFSVEPKTIAELVVEIEKR